MALTTVGNTGIVDTGITTSKIKDLAVTTGKIEDLSITTAKLAATSVTSVKLASGAGSNEWNLVGTGNAPVQNTATMTVYNNYAVNTYAGTFTLTLPSGSAMGQTIRIADIAGGAAANNIIIDRNTNNQIILGNSSANLALNIARNNIGLVYMNSTFGWILEEK